MLKRTVKFIHNLRIYLFVLILVSFLFVIGLNPVDYSVFLGSKLGRAMGLSVSVPENPINKLALELKQKEDQLDQKELDLNQREAEIEKQIDAKYNPAIIILSAGILVLFFLILVNYFLDYRRKKVTPQLSDKNK